MLGGCASQPPPREKTYHEKTLGFDYGMIMEVQSDGGGGGGGMVMEV